MTLEIRKALLLSVCCGLMTTSLGCARSASEATAFDGGNLNTNTAGGTGRYGGTDAYAGYGGNTERNGNTADKNDSCANLDLTLDRQPTTIMLVIDGSATMNLQLGDNDTRWSEVHKTLMGTTSAPETGLVWALEDKVNFGMVLFTAVRPAPGKASEPGTCPLLSTVEPGLNNGRAISEIFLTDNLDYMGASPVPEAIDAAVDILNAMKKPSKKVIVLATDGLPQTCDTLATPADSVGEAATVASVQNAYNHGIQTFVIGVGNEVTAAHLQKVANAGAGLPPEGNKNAVYYQSETENTLVDAMSDVITEESRSCIYELQGKGVVEGQEGRGSILLEGKALEMDNTQNGWRLKSRSEFELLGKACEDIQFGEHHLKADFPCETIVILI
jgi:hypothetical protein